MKAKKAQIGLGLVQKVFIAFLILSVTAIAIFLALDSVTDILTITTSNSASQSILTETTATLSPIGDGITSNTITAKNNTWLEFDNTDFLNISDDPNDPHITVSFWVNNSNNDWIHVVNTSGILYENGIEVDSLTLNAYRQLGSDPIEWIFGLNSTGFFSGNIDQITFYNDTINQSVVTEIFNNGR